MASDTRAARPGLWELTAPYRAVLGSRVRSQRTYRASFATDLLSSLFVGVTEFAEVWVVFHNVSVLGGLDFDAVLLLFGLSNFSFSAADLLVGHLDTLPTYIRMGTLDAFYLRPQPILAQLMTSELSLRRVARMGVALVAIVAGFARNDVVWGVDTGLMLVLALVAGTAIFSGLFVCAASLQFFLVNGAEMTNSFTYGGSYAAQQPTSIFPSPLKAVFGYLVPVAFTSYLPTLWLLDLPGPAGLPSWLGWFSPVAAGWVWLVAALLWRFGVRHYQGGGG